MQSEANEARFRKEKGEMMEELNRLAEEREEIEDLARANQHEIESNAMNQIEEIKLEMEESKQEEIEQFKRDYEDLLRDIKSQSEKDMNTLRSNATSHED